jgi:hypothetical protein
MCLDIIWKPFLSICYAGLNSAHIISGVSICLHRIPPFFYYDPYRRICPHIVNGSHIEALRLILYGSHFLYGPMWSPIIM